MSMPTDDELNAIVEMIVQRTLRASTSSEDPPQVDIANPSKAIAIGADHGGFKMKQMLGAHLTKNGYQLLDCGTHDTRSVDYPDFALAVAEKVSSGQAWRGIVIDGAGIGSCMAANKVAGVRAAMCYDHATAVNSREHNDANVLSLGAGLIGEALALQIVETWLATGFAGGRHARRVEKIMAIESKVKVSGR